MAKADARAYGKCSPERVWFAAQHSGMGLLGSFCACAAEARPPHLSSRDSREAVWEALGSARKVEGAQLGREGRVCAREWERKREVRGIPAPSVSGCDQAGPRPSRPVERDPGHWFPGRLGLSAGREQVPGAGRGVRDRSLARAAAGGESAFVTQATTCPKSPDGASASRPRALELEKPG